MSLTGEIILNKKLTLESHPCNIILVEPFIDAFRCAYLINDEVYNNMLVCITEAVNNSILHGNRGNEKKLVRLSLKKDKNKVICFVQDEGNGFDFKNLPDPTAPENIENTGGRGIFLMKHLSDLVIFSNDGSNVEIQFKL